MVDKANQAILLDSCTDLREKARVHSVSLPKAGAWLHAVPSKALGLHMQSKEMKVNLHYRLGIEVFASSGLCSVCGMESDALGDHAIACGGHGERIMRHNDLRDILHHTAAQAGLRPAREELALLPGSNARPADVFLTHWSNGKDTALDVTVVSSLQQTLVVRSAATAGAALAHAYSRKENQSMPDCLQEGLIFIPLPLECLGGFHQKTCEVVKTLGRQLSLQTGCDEAQTVNHLFQRLSIMLMKGNSALFTSRMPTFPSQIIDGDRDT